MFYPSTEKEGEMRTGTQELDGEEKPGRATTCKWRCASGEIMPILPPSEYISAGTTEEMPGPCFKMPGLCCLL